MKMRHPARGTRSFEIWDLRWLASLLRLRTRGAQDIFELRFNFFFQRIATLTLRIRSWGRITKFHQSWRTSLEAEERSCASPCRSLCLNWMCFLKSSFFYFRGPCWSRLYQVSANYKGKLVYAKDLTKVEGKQEIHLWNFTNNMIPLRLIRGFKVCWSFSNTRK